MVCKGRRGSGYDSPKEELRCLLQQLMEEELATLVGAERLERSEERVNQGNGAWRRFPQSPVARGVRGVKLVVSDAHPGLKQALAGVCVGTTW